LIAINAELRVGRVVRLALATPYAEAVHRAGGLPLVLAPLTDLAYARELLADCDGLLFTGGDDFDTERLGRGPTHPEASPVPGEKQDFDLELAGLALERDLAVLGICYGMQVLGIQAGAGFLQHLPDEWPGSRDHRGGIEHQVELASGTKLREALGVASLEVVSRHHQALADPGRGWKVAARDDEGLIEAIECEDRPFAIGVQWHPELSPPGGGNDRLFRAFVDAARARAAQRTRARGAIAR
jgi:putative glutamine amidotransferase